MFNKKQIIFMTVFIIVMGIFMLIYSNNMYEQCELDGYNKTQCTAIMTAASNGRQTMYD